MDTSFLEAFELKVGDGLDHGGPDPGPDALLPVLYGNPFDGKPRRYAHFGEACFRYRAGNWEVLFNENIQGFDRFMEALKLYKLHEHRFWKDAYLSAANVWKHKELVQSAEENIFFSIDHIEHRIQFFENPSVALLFNTLEKMAMAALGPIKIELAEDDE